MTAREKRLVQAYWTLFVGTLSLHYHDKEKCFGTFGDELYRHLVQHCSFIAHYSRAGFFEYYFESPANTLRFIGQFDAVENPHGSSTEYSDSRWLHGAYADINQAMRDDVAPFIRSIRERVATDDCRPRFEHADQLVGVS